MQLALPARDDVPHEITTSVAPLTDRIGSEGATSALSDELKVLCVRAAPMLQHRHHLLDQLSRGQRIAAQHAPVMR